MYQTKYAKGAVPIGDFIRQDEGSEAFYECIGGNASKSMTFLQSHVNSAKCKTKMQKLLLVDNKNLTVVPVIKVTIIAPALPKQKSGVKLGTKRPKFVKRIGRTKVTVTTFPDGSKTKKITNE